MLVPSRRHAEFSEDRLYRYWLDIVFDIALPRLCFVMLNPSMADEKDNDPTVERCMRRALMYGFGSVVITNIFAWVSTDKRVLPKVMDPIGPKNDQAIVEAATSSSQTICAWGNDGLLLTRGPEVLKLLRRCGITPYALHITKRLQPQHPLYLPYDLEPIEIPN